MPVLLFDEELYMEGHHVHRTFGRVQNDARVAGNDSTVTVDKRSNIVAEIEWKMLVHSMDVDILRVCMDDTLPSDDRIHPSEEQCHNGRASDRISGLLEERRRREKKANVSMDFILE